MFPCGWRFSYMSWCDVRDLVEREDLRQAGVDLAGEHEVVQPLRLLVVGEVRALEALLAHPEVAQVDVAL